MNPIFIALGIAAIVYLPTIIGLVKLNIRIVSVIPIDIKDKLIRLNDGIKYFNTTKKRIDLNQLSADVLLNGFKIGTINQTYSVPLLPGREQVISNIIELSPDNLGDQLWHDAININLKNFVLELKGYVVANGKRLPYNSMWTITDFVNSKGVSAVDSLSGIGKLKEMTVDSVVNAAWQNRQTGNEKICNDTLHWGVGPTHYIYVNDIKEFINSYDGYRKITYAVNHRNDNFGAFFNKYDLELFVKWLKKRDGYLYVDY